MPDVHDIERAIATAEDREVELRCLPAKEGRDRTEHEQAELDGLPPKIESYEADKARIEALDAKREQSIHAGRQVSPDNSRNVNQDSASRRTGDIRVGHDRLCLDPYGGYGPEDGREVDRQELSRVIGEFSLDVRNAKDGLNPRLAKWQRARMDFAAGDGMTTAVGHEGGYLIPTIIGNLINDRALEMAVIRPRATVIPMTSQSMELPAVDDTDHSSGTVFGGVQAYFTGEEAQLTESKPKIAKVKLTMHKLTCLSYVSGEMLDWSPISIGTWLPEKLSQAKAWKEETKFISGNGAAGEPAGLLNSDCKIEISAETEQSATTIIFDNIIKMYARVWDQIGSLIWLANKTTLTQLPKLVCGDGTTAVPIFLPNTSAEGAPLQTLFGIPIIFTEHCKALGTAGDLVLVNLGEYYIGDASGKERSDVNMGLKFDFDQMAFRLIGYTGGTSGWRTEFTPENGDSLSPIVTLEAR